MPISRKTHGTTLLELLIAIILLSIVVLGVSSIDFFSRAHLISSDRRVKLQNELSYCLEYMTKGIMLGTGSQGSATTTQPIKWYPSDEAPRTGFSVRVDPRNAEENPTPQDTGDDLWFNYYLDGNSLKFSCAKVNESSSPSCPAGETLTGHIIAGVTSGVMPANPGSGFYINLTNSNTAIEVGLVARFNPTNINISTENPQIEMKASMQTRGSAAR